MKVIVAGGSGFIGSALVAALAARGDEVVLLSRDASKTRPGARTVAWDGKDAAAAAAALEGADAVVNLAGENIAAGQPSAEAAFTDWMASPGHRANIERAGFRRIGVGYQPGVVGDPYGHYWTQMFTD